MIEQRHNLFWNAAAEEGEIPPVRTLQTADLIALGGGWRGLEETGAIDGRLMACPIISAKLMADAQIEGNLGGRPK